MITTPSRSAALLDLLNEGREADTAVLDVAGRNLTYGELRKTVHRLGAQLRDAGVRSDDRVGFVLPNGLSAAVVFLAVSAHAVAAPLNPAYTATELAFYLMDLGARFLITADSLQVPFENDAIVELRLVGSGADLELQWIGGTHSVAREGPPPSDGTTALVLHTSGTTSRPKRVPLTQANLAASALAVAASLELRPEDRCLNVMPLFHIHGLVAGLLATLAAGASVVCTPGFDALKFRRWLDEFSPTWYTAVPTMHHALAERVFPELGESHSLRFVRSCSAPLPPLLAEKIERSLRVPVVEAYGMTEAAHQIASNPLPPQTRKFGSVGLPPAGTLTVLDASGKTLPALVSGEIAIRGNNVTSGYEGLAQGLGADESSQWLRTGDQGFIDQEGYVFLTGRIKEIINRGGEKIAPREVDEVLEAHPSVLHALAFSVPHKSLGEEVGVAVVVRPGSSVTEAALRKHAASALAPFKVPRRIVFVEELPKGPTGKLQRIGLAERLGLAPDKREHAGS